MRTRTTCMHKILSLTLQGVVGSNRRRAESVEPHTLTTTETITREKIGWPRRPRREHNERQI